MSSSWIKRTPFTWTKLVEKNGRPWLKVHSLREGPKFAQGQATTCFLKYEDGEFWVGSVLDTDIKKGNNPSRLLTGGMLKFQRQTADGESFSQESFIEGAREEALAETGFLAPLASDGSPDLYPATRIIKVNFPGRSLESDESSGKPAIVTQCVFVHFGDVSFIETNDIDAKDPKWTRLSEVFNPVHSGRGGKEAWFRSHIMILATTLRYLLSRIGEFESGKMKAERDVSFFEKFLMLEKARKDSNGYYEVMEYHNYLKGLLEGVAGIDTQMQKLHDDWLEARKSIDKDNTIHPKRKEIAASKLLEDMYRRQVFSGNGLLDPVYLMQSMYYGHDLAEAIKFVWRFNAEPLGFEKYFNLVNEETSPQIANKYKHKVAV